MLKFVPVGMLLSGALMLVYGMFGDVFPEVSEAVVVSGLVVVVFGTLLITVKSGYWS